MDDIGLLQVIAAQSTTIADLQRRLQEERDLAIGLREEIGRYKNEAAKLAEAVGGKDKAAAAVALKERVAELEKKVAEDNDNLARLEEVEENFKALEPLFEEMLVQCFAFARPVRAASICTIPLQPVRDLGEIIYGIRP